MLLFSTVCRRFGRHPFLSFSRRLQRETYAVLLLVMLLVSVWPVGAHEDADEKASVPGPGESVDRLAGSSAEGVRTSLESDGPKAESVPKTKDQTESNAIKMYQRLFRQKQAYHLEAMEKIQQLGSYDKRFKMIQLVLTKIFTVMSDARIRLMESGFTPGDPFPVKDGVRDALSIVLENTAFLGQIVLRLPDIAHVLLRNNTEWQLVTRWGVGFCNDTKILGANEAELISLMAQELGIIEKSSDFINPYRDDAKLEKLVDSEVERMLQEKTRAAAKKKERREKKKRRGPRLTPSRHNEL